MKKIVFIRHGESAWNQENRFCGWVNVDLSEKGIKEAHEAGKALKNAGYSFDLAFTSVLLRANHTLDIVLEELGEKNIEVRKSWKLNERHYGALQGLNKAETAVKYGEDQVKIWRRSYDVPPPKLSESDEMYPGKDPLYQDLKKEEIPLSESLKDTLARTLPYWKEEIVPELEAGKNIIVAAHGNSLRSLVKYIENMSEADILEFNMPTGIPMVYELDDNLNFIKKYFIGDEETVKKAMEAVANQGKVKK